MPRVDKLIVTTYFANVHKVLKEGFTLYSIAQSQPTDCNFETFSLLVPSDFCRSLAAQKRFADYEREYKRINLHPDKRDRLIEDIAALHGIRIAFLCWEGRDKFCHRHIVAKYLNRYNICSAEVHEF